MLTGEKPFPELSSIDLQKLILEIRARPKIPLDWPPRLINLIKSCWDEDPSNRLKFIEISEILNFV